MKPYKRDKEVEACVLQTQEICRHDFEVKEWVEKIGCYGNSDRWTTRELCIHCGKEVVGDRKRPCSCPVKMRDLY